MNRAAFVVNPTKVSSPAALRQRAETFMSRAGWEPPLWLETTEDDPGVGMCKQAVEEGCTVVFVCGGDGTVMAAATALSGTDVPMAILPLGHRREDGRPPGRGCDERRAQLEGRVEPGNEGIERQEISLHGSHRARCAAAPGDLMSPTRVGACAAACLDEGPAIQDAEGAS